MERGVERIIFSTSGAAPTSAASERVFARCKLMFGDQQLRALGDRVEVGLMLAENGRMLG